MTLGIRKVAVAGAGTMGHGIAQAFAQAGYKVSMVARTHKTLDRAVALIESSLNTMADEEILNILVASRLPPLWKGILGSTETKKGE